MRFLNSDYWKMVPAPGLFFLQVIPRRIHTMTMPIKRLGCGLKVGVGDTERERRPGARWWSLYRKKDNKGKLANACATCGGHELNLPKIVDLLGWLENGPADGTQRRIQKDVDERKSFFFY